jgi:DNA-binding NtrC family response regulator
MSLRMQAAVLRFLETGETQPIGASTRRLDVRVMAATNRDLSAQIVKREFREDLYYRLNVLSIRVPSLRERPADIAPLLRHFLASYSHSYGASCPELTPGAEALLCAYPWPGNVRQLKNITERLVVRRAGQPITIHDLPPEILLADGASGPVAPSGKRFAGS